MTDQPSLTEKLRDSDWCAEIRAQQYMAAAAMEIEQRDAEIERLQDKIDGLKIDLDSALNVLWRRGDDGAREWVRLNYREFAAARALFEGRMR